MAECNVMQLEYIRCHRQLQVSYVSLQMLVIDLAADQQYAQGQCSSAGHFKALQAMPALKALAWLQQSVVQCTYAARLYSSVHSVRGLSHGRKV
eukprot:5593-Heterococcus_DN1.PRE.2